MVDASVGAKWFVSSMVMMDAALGYGSERPKAKVWRSTDRWARLGVVVALPHGFTVGSSVQGRWARYEGNWFPFTRDGSSRSDRTLTLTASLYNRGFTIYGFSPQVVVTKEIRDSNAQLHDYDRLRGELRFVRQF